MNAQAQLALEVPTHFPTHLPRIPKLHTIIIRTDCGGNQTDDRHAEVDVEDFPVLEYRRIDPLDAGVAEIRASLASRVYTRIQDKLCWEIWHLYVAQAAPRYAHTTHEQANIFVYAELEGQVVYIGTGGECLRDVKHLILPGRAWQISLTEKKTNYRSRHLGECVYRIFQGEKGMFVKPLDLDSIPGPDLKPQVIARDHTGNIVLSLREGDEPLRDARPGELFWVTINRRLRVATFREHLGDANSLELVLAAGSTRLGRDETAPASIYLYWMDTQAVKLFRNWNLGHHESGLPLCGTPVNIRPVKRTWIAKLWRALSQR